VPFSLFRDANIVLITASRPTQYRYHFRKWEIKKRITSEEKDAAINALGKRMRPGASTSLITFRDGDVEKPVDTKQLKRYINDHIRHDQELKLAGGVYVNKSIF
jgi:hypothetical protein